MTINFEAPFNSTSIGQTSYNIYRELSKLSDICLFPVGDSIDLSTFNLSNVEKEKIQNNVKESESNFSPFNSSLTIWHIKGSEKTSGRDSNLLTFHETDTLTLFELNRLLHKRKIFVASKYTQEVFRSALDSENQVVYCPLGFDSHSFSRIEKDPNDEVITFGLRGKLEKRKHTLKVMSAWAKTFGGDPRYRLDCSVFNMFLGDSQADEIRNAMPDKTIPWNINLLPFLHSNELYNKALNNADIDLTGMSGAEGFNLPLFQSLCLGKQAIVLNAHVHKDFCHDRNSILIEPSGKIQADDGVFFHKGQLVNQGFWHDFKESDLIDAMIFAAEQGRIRNTEGEKLQSWTFENTAKIIKENI